MTSRASILSTIKDQLATSLYPSRASNLLLARTHHSAPSVVEAEGARELICLGQLGSQWILTAKAEKFRKHVLKTKRTIVCSVLGDSGVGKSHFLQHIISDTARPFINQSDKPLPTTSNVNYYFGDPFTNNSNTIFLDYEGLNNSTIPLTIKHRPQTLITNPTERASKVSEILPKLAYSISNVLIYITTKPFDSSLIQQCIKFALQANQAVDEIQYRPLLVLINNMSPLNSEFDSNKITQDFRESHEESREIFELLQYYSDIKCFHLPNTTELKTKKKDPNLIYEQQIEIITQVIGDYTKNKDRLNLKTGKWLKLLDEVLALSNNQRPVKVYNLLLELKRNKSRNGIVKIGIDLFIRLRNEIDFFDSKKFFQVRDIVTKFLIHLIKVEAVQKKLDNEVALALGRQVVVHFLDEVSSLLPCTATYPGSCKSPPNSRTQKTCLQPRITHGPSHRTCSDTRTQEDSFCELVKDVLLGSTKDTWKGTHESRPNQSEFDLLEWTEEMNDALNDGLSSHQSFSYYSKPWPLSAKNWFRIGNECSKCLICGTQKFYLNIGKEFLPENYLPQYITRQLSRMNRPPLLDLCTECSETYKFTQQKINPKFPILFNEISSKEIDWREQRKGFVIGKDYHLKSGLSQFILESFPKSLKVKDVDFVWNEEKAKRFEEWVENKDGIRKKESESEESRKKEENRERIQILEKLKEKYRSSKVEGNARTLFMFCPCPKKDIEMVSKNGIERRKGGFGFGCYFTSSVEYAAELCCSTQEIGKDCVMLLCMVAVSNVYPITRDLDYEDQSISRFHYASPIPPQIKDDPVQVQCYMNQQLQKKTRSKAHYAFGTYDSHYVLVSKENNFEATTDQNDYDELIIKNGNSVLPLAFIHFNR